MKRLLREVGIVGFSLIALLMALVCLWGSTDSGYFMGTKYSSRWLNVRLSYDGTFESGLVHFGRRHGGKVPESMDALMSGGFSWPDRSVPMSRATFVGHYVWKARVRLAAALCFWLTGWLVYSLRALKRTEIYIVAGACVLLFVLSFWVGHIGQSKEYVKFFSLVSVKENPPAAGAVVAFRPAVEAIGKVKIWKAPMDPDAPFLKSCYVGPDEWEALGLGPWPPPLMGENEAR